MPIYEYECCKCGKIVEAWQNLSDKPVAACPDCSGAMKKLISRSSFQLKGGGWYSDGYSCTSSAKSSCAGTKSDNEKSDNDKTKTAGEPAGGCSAEKKAACGCGG